jgi:AraC-like DNA-binding protein
MQEKQSGGQALSEAACAWLETHCADKYSLAEMAKALFVNGSYLTRAFKRYTGMTPLAYHHRLRCAKARELLSSSGLTVSQVGETVGYVSSSHFAHIFRKLEGCSPSEFQRSHRHEAAEGTDG